MQTFITRILPVEQRQATPTGALANCALSLPAR
jgi:hypothetical protein